MITNYSTLKIAVGNWLARDDLSTYIPDFIQFGEKKLYRQARTRGMEKALEETIADGVVDLPSDYVELKYAYLNTNPIQALERKTPDWIYKKYPTRSATSKPVYVSREAETLIFGPYPDSTYEVIGVYYARLPGLSDTNTTNWFTTNAPDLLLYAALAEASLFIEDEENTAKYDRLFERVRLQIEREDAREALSGSTIRVSVG